MLASDVDAVYIATPPYLHPEHFEAAVKSRKHIFMEKPAGVDPAGCRRVIAAAKKADKTKRITVDYQQRYGKDYRKAYDDREVGRAGRDQARSGRSWLGGGLPVREGHRGQRRADPQLALLSREGRRHHRRAELP